MAVDEAMMRAVQAGVALPTLRLYAWSPPCLSIGAHQRVSEDINIEACVALGIHWVRRPTGGRAILHDAEVTYSVAVGQDDPRVSGDVMTSYRRISQGLMVGLRRLGVPAEMADPQGAGHRLGPAACFAAPSPHEILVQGRKLVGSAQRRQGDVLLQHGSLLLDMDIERLMAVLRFASPEEQASMRARVVRESITLREIMGSPVPYETVATALEAGFREALGLELVPSDLTPWEREEVHRLLEEKYRHPAWLFRC